MSRYADDATISGSIVVTGSATFNDQSKDVDFTVESDGNAHMLHVDAGNDRVGIGTGTPGITLEVEAAAGDIFKMENTTAYGMTYGQLVKESLTLTDRGYPADTTLDLPAASTIDTVLVTIKTLAVGDVSTIDNIALTYGGQTSNIKGSSFSGLSLVGNGSTVIVGTQYAISNTDQSFPAGAAALLLPGAADIKIDYTETNITTEPIVDVVIFYRKFDTS